MKGVVQTFNPVSLGVVRKNLMHVSKENNKRGRKHVEGSELKFLDFIKNAESLRNESKIKAVLLMLM